MSFQAAGRLARASRRSGGVGGNGTGPRQDGCRSAGLSVPMSRADTGIARGVFAAVEPVVTGAGFSATFTGLVPAELASLSCATRAAGPLDAAAGRAPRWTAICGVERTQSTELLAPVDAFPRNATRYGADAIAAGWARKSATKSVFACLSMSE